jgi:hypothetical protein
VTDRDWYGIPGRRVHRCVACPATYKTLAGLSAHVEWPATTRQRRSHADYLRRRSLNRQDQLARQAAGAAGSVLADRQTGNSVEDKSRTV